MSSIYGSAAGANVIFGKNNVGVAFGGAAPEPITWYDTLEHAGSAVESGWATAITERGEGMKTDASAMIGQTVTKVQVYLKKFGSPSGDITCAVKAIADNALRVTIGTMDVDELRAIESFPTWTSDDLYTFDSSTNPSYELTDAGDGDVISIHFAGDDSNAIKTLSSNSVSRYDTDKSGRGAYGSGTSDEWSIDAGEDLIALFAGN